jgi:drug/metabolite transporter (DMT)-like permease
VTHQGTSSASPRFGRGEFWALGAALAYALYQVFLRVAVRGGGLHTYVGATVQALPTLLFCLVMGWAIKRRSAATASPFSNWRLIGALILSGLLLFVVATPLFFEALRKGGVLITSPLTGTQVLWASLLAALLLREPLTRVMVLGMVISVVGVAVLTLGRSGGANLAPTWWLAVPFALGAGLCWALSGVLLTYNMRRGVDRHQALGIATLVGLILINAYLLVTGDIGLYATTPASIFLSLLGAGLFNAAALISLMTALSLTTVVSATTLNSLQVALAPLIAWLFLKEDLNLLSGMGIALILVGVLIVQRARATVKGG